MGRDPKSFITFRRKGDATSPTNSTGLQVPIEPTAIAPVGETEHPYRPTPQARTEAYQLALELAALLYKVVELAEAERYFLRDQLDKTSTVIPVMIAQGLATAEMHERRKLYRRARKAAVDCVAILDVLGERNTVEPQAIEAARVVAVMLAENLETLTIAPPKVR